MTSNGSFLPWKEEHFVGWDVVADHPEYAVDTDPAVEVLTGVDGHGGVVRVTMDAGQSNVGGMGLGQAVWDVVTHGIFFEARIRLSAIGAADERVGFWLTDLQEDTISEYPFTMTTTALTAVADPNDAVGIFWEGNGPDSWVFAGQGSDSVTANSIANPVELVAPVADQWDVLAFEIAPGGTAATAWVNGRVIGTYKSATTIVGSVAMYPVLIGVTEGTGAINADLDYYRIGSRLQA